MKPLDRLKYHVTGAIERGEKTAIETVTSKHTPGPWQSFIWDDSKPDTITVGASRLCSNNGGRTKDHLFDIDCSGPDYVKEEMKANAYLIAAAPEMLEALEKIESELLDVDMEIPEYLTLAIAKARGES